VGVGTTSPAAKFQVFMAAGSTGPLVQVTTGTTKLFEVTGASIAVGVPISFPDGSSISRGNTFCQIKTSSLSAAGATTNTKIVILFPIQNGANQYISSGTCFNYSTASILIQGSTITIMERGQYFFSYQRDETSAAQIGIVINGTEPTTNYASTTVGRKVCSTVGGQGAAADFAHTASCNVWLEVGDKVWFQTQGGTQTGTSAFPMNFFEMTKMKDDR
jgi:hypothetical protein